MNTPVIAVDGPNAAGKGTICKRIAEDLGFHLLDSGALYRLVALAATNAEVSLDDVPAVTAMTHQMAIEFRPTPEAVKVYLEGADVSRDIRTETVGNRASMVAALPPVRAALLERQRGFRRPPGLVADGRDMGTVVFPDAAVKIFLTASAEVRAQRRYNQLRDQGISVNLAALSAEIEERDRRDRERAASPLLPAEDAIELDTSALDIDGVFEVIRARIMDRGIH
ncbi:MAG: (d)CMP kinase [Pseudomonadota bacterium]